MGHGLTANDTMFSVKTRPWHKLGVVLDNPPTVDEAIVIAGLDWEAKIKQVNDDEFGLIPEHIVYKEVDGVRTRLGTTGPIFTPLQNKDAFEFFNPFLDSGEASLETAGSLFDGQKVFITAKVNVPNAVIVPKSSDEVECFLLLSNAHDGTGSVTVALTPIRVVCNNTLMATLNGKKIKKIKVKHGANVKENLMLLQETVNLSKRTFEASTELYKHLATRQIDQADLKKYVKEVFNLEPTENEYKDLDTGKDRGRLLPQIIELFETGRGNTMEGVKGTYWAAYNAVTEYLTHYRGRSEDSRFNSLWYGDSDRVNFNAIKTAALMTK